MSKSESGLFVLGRRKPKPTMTFSGFSATLKKITASSEMSPQVELMGALRRWINDARPDLRVVASGEEFEAFKKEFFVSEGVHTLGVLLEFIKKGRKRYSEHNKPAVKKARRRRPNKDTDTLRADREHQEMKANGERVSWNKIARKVLSTPGQRDVKTSKDGTKSITLWPKRVRRLKDNVTSHDRRERSAKRR
jgi:hypothetical protein